MAWNPVYSTRFLLARVHTAGTPSVTYTVPTGMVAVITCMTATKNLANTAAQVSFAVDPSGSGGAVTVWWVTQSSTTLIENSLWLGRIALHAGDQLVVARSGAASDASITASGFLLTNL